MTLCAQLDVEQKLTWDITAEPDTTVAALIADAQALIESEIGRTIESATDRSETFTRPRNPLYLKWWPVTAISQVTEDGTVLAATDYALDTDEWRLWRVSNGYPISWRATKLQGIVVTYEGGYKAGFSAEHDMALEHLGSLCAEVVARGFYRGAKTAVAGNTPALAEIQSISLDGSDTVTYATATGDSFSLSGGVMQFIYLEDDQRRQLDRYKGVLVA